MCIRDRGGDDSGVDDLVEIFFSAIQRSKEAALVEVGNGAGDVALVDAALLKRLGAVSYTHLGGVDVDGTEAIDTARRVGADDAGGLLAKLALDGEAVLDLIRDLGVRLELDDVGRLGREGEAIADGNAA